MATAPAVDTQFIQALSDFFNPRQPFSGKAPPAPTELAVALAIQWLGNAGKKTAIETLRSGIRLIVETRRPMGKRVSWDEADVLCSQALGLYLELTREYGSGWEEQTKDTLAYLTELFWLLPDRIVGEGEEKTNCTFYLYNEPCMLKSKEMLFSWMTKSWDLKNPSEPVKENSVSAFRFICSVFVEGRGTSERKTHPDNIAVLNGYHERNTLGAEHGRVLFAADREMFLGILKKHCANTKLEELQPWVRDDLPGDILDVFQETLARSPHRSIALALLKGAVPA